MSPMVMKRPNLGQSRGSILIEVLVSVLIFAFGVLGLVGLQAAGVRATTDAKFRADASYIANKAISDMWLDRENLANFAAAGVAEPGLPEGEKTVVINGSQVSVTLTWKVPGRSESSNIVVVAQISG